MQGSRPEQVCNPQRGSAYPTLRTDYRNKGNPCRQTPLLYNLPNPNSFNLRMRTLHYSRACQSRWSRCVLVLVICSLMFSVATRFSLTTHSHFHTVKTFDSDCSQPKRQHLDNDAAHWAAPVAVALVLEHVSVYPRAIVADTLPPSQVFDESLYNRPPPSLL